MNFFRISSALILSSVISVTNAQNFTWMKGDNNIAQSGNYGTIGAPLASNHPGARVSMAYWKDNNGKFWVFGGQGYDQQGNSGQLNDLWKYDPSTNMWTWMKGDIVFLQMGKYGTQGVASSTNNPGARDGAAAWTDNAGNLWLFGGYGYGAGLQPGYLNDLWKFDPLLSQWTWINGSDQSFATGNYDSLGITSTTISPGSRKQSLTWKDGNGKFWLFGGTGMTSSTFPVGVLNDLWSFDPLTAKWAWVKGSALTDQAGTYGNIGSGAPANQPGGREGAMGWIDQTGNLWLFGREGVGGTSAGGQGYLADMWRYSISNNQWTWAKGSASVNQPGNYGTQGVSLITNIPGARTSGYTIRDGGGHVWLFGGKGHEGSANSGELGDLWMYNESSNEWVWIKGPGLINQQAIYGTQTVAGATTRPGSRHDGATWIDGANNLWLFGGSGYPASSNDGFLNDVWKYNNCYISPITMSVVSNNTISCANEPAILTASGSDNYSWAQGVFSPTVVVSPTTTTTYTVYTSGSNNCVYSAAYTQTVQTCAGLQEQITSSMRIIPNPSTGKLTINGKGFSFMVTDMQGRIVSQKPFDAVAEKAEVELAPGVYSAIIREGDVTTTKRIVVLGN
jgi:N-acetylneuraminic acid mutarotase